MPLNETSVFVGEEFAWPHDGAGSNRRDDGTFGPNRHCEERSDEAIHTVIAVRWIASLRSQ
jgi:hypothetical protein